MKYVGRTKVGKIKPNSNTVLAIVRLPVELKEYAGKWAHIWKVDDDTLVIKFSNSREIEGLAGVHFGVEYWVEAAVNERLIRLEMAVEELKSLIMDKTPTVTNKTNSTNAGGGIRTHAGRAQWLSRPPPYHSATPAFKTPISPQFLNVLMGIQGTDRYSRHAKA